MYPKHMHSRLALGALALLLGGVLAGCPTVKEPKVALTDAIKREATKVDFKQLLDDANTAALAYEDRRPIVEKFGNEKTVILANRNRFGRMFLVTDDQRNLQILSIRGTVTGNDLADGIDVRKLGKIFSDGKIMYFRGFLEETNHLFTAVRPRLKKDYDLRIIGHSRGGAMALILYKMLTNAGFDPAKIEVVTFGQPKITNRDGANKYGRLNLTRVVNGRDLVPRYPFFGPIANVNGRYIQFGQAVYLWKDRAWSLVPSAEERRITRKQHFIKIGEARVRFHPIKRYIERLGRVDKNKLIECCPFKGDRD